MYDNLPTDVVEMAAHVVSNLWGFGDGILEHQAVADAATVLRSRWPSVGELREICERIQKRIENEDTDEEITRFVYLTAEEYATQKVAKVQAPPADCFPKSEPAFIGNGVPHSELAVPLEKRATSTTNFEEARSLAIHAAKILAGLASILDENGKRRFSDEQIAVWTAPDGRSSPVADDSLNADHAPTTREGQQMETMRVEAGSIPIQHSFSPQPPSPVCVSTTPEQEISLKRWRNAEQRVCELLRKLGWQVEDVSQQKMGYDIVGRDPEGKDTFIDVKSIEKEGEPFTLTPHEMAVAGQKGRSYHVAVVRQANLELEIALIADPAHRLKLTQKCRQWEWECAEYEFNPQRYPLD
jgi:hypothetical protein